MDSPVICQQLPVDAAKIASGDEWEELTMAAQPLTSLDRSTLRERSLEALRTAITSGEYRPGDHLGEEELAGRLGVSRGTVREALRHLQQEGLVTAGDPGSLSGTRSAGRARSHLDHRLAETRRRGSQAA
jgi:DNA-binding FadR family transcriptional regulator